MSKCSNLFTIIESHHFHLSLQIYHPCKRHFFRIIISFINFTQCKASIQFECWQVTDQYGMLWSRRHHRLCKYRSLEPVRTADPAGYCTSYAPPRFPFVLADTITSKAGRLFRFTGRMLAQGERECHSRGSGGQLCCCGRGTTCPGPRSPDPYC